MKTNLFLCFGTPVGALMRTGEIPSPGLYTVSTLQWPWFFPPEAHPLVALGTSLLSRTELGKCHHSCLRSNVEKRRRQFPMAVGARGSHFLSGCAKKLTGNLSSQLWSWKSILTQGGLSKSIEGSTATVLGGKRCRSNLKAHHEENG